MADFIIVDCLRVAIQSVVEGKKVWIAGVQWLTLLAPPVPASKAKKRGQAANPTLNKPSKRQQLLTKHTPRWTEEGSTKKEKGQPSQKAYAETEAPNHRLSPCKSNSAGKSESYPPWFKE